MKLTKSYLRKIIKEEVSNLTEIGVYDTARGPHDKRAPTEPVYNRETEGYIIDEFDDLRKRIKVLEDGIDMILSQLAGAETPNRPQ
jgi:dGTP triphosphohydrolase